MDTISGGVKRAGGRANICAAMSEPVWWVVWSFEHDGWWRPGGWGYTPHLAEAGHYTEADARRIEHQANYHRRTVYEKALSLEEALTLDRVDPGFTCPRCGATSYNANDFIERYCARCKVFVDDPSA
jgi:hypothetical protein